jgi:hypothetical protein
MIYSNPVTWDALSEPERAAMMTEAETIMSELVESGEWVGGAALADPANSLSVRVRGEAPAVTDGPYLEAKEYLAGYCVVECESIERATEIAARWPDARYTGLEVRPIMDTGGDLAM